jgi:tRNA nucleotidyltransferase (CCA-adding enzyme)
MKIDYQPKSELERFGKKVFDLLVDNFPQTFYVGGMVRDLLLGKKITDIDIATQATPPEVIKLLNDNNVICDGAHSRFGIVVAKKGSYKIEVATFRKDLPSKNRYPKISFVKTAKQDSARRDFTINALYLSPKKGDILDFHHGLNDLKSRALRFIGNPEKRIKEDPLRIIRALRFAQTLNFKLDNKTKSAVKNNFHLTETLTTTRIQNELGKVRNPKYKKFLCTAIGRQSLLDKK